MHRRIVMLLILFLLSMTFVLVPPLYSRDASASSQVSAVVVAHKNSASLNGGQVANTTTLYSSSTQTIAQSASNSSKQFSTSWVQDPCLASSITIVSAIVFNVYLKADAALSGVTLGAQLNQIASCGTGSETGLFSGEQTTTISLTTTQAGYQVSIPVGAGAVIPADYSLHFIVYVNPNTGSTLHTITLSYDSSSAPADFTLGIDNPVTVNSLTVSPQTITSPTTATATISVSDAFGLYDIASASFSASTEGVVATSGTMAASSANQPTGLTGTWNGVVDPSSSSYADFNGVWSVLSTVTDQSGNTYQSTPSTFVYSQSSGSTHPCPATGCPTDYTTTTSQTGFNIGSLQIPMDPIYAFIVLAFILAVVVTIYLAVRYIENR